MIPVQRHYHSTGLCELEVTSLYLFLVVEIKINLFDFLLRAKKTFVFLVNRTLRVKPNRWNTEPLTLVGRLQGVRVRVEV